MISDPSKQLSKRVNPYESGFTLFEVLIAIVISSVVFLALFSNFRALERPLYSGAEITSGFFRLARAKAISQTQSVLVLPASNSSLHVKTGKNCTDARNSSDLESDLSLQLPFGVYFLSIEWDICFTSRGFIDDSTEFNLVDKDGKQLKIQTFLGGTTKII
ncbi:MAG TPA: prepilin-type N-terminal cleavage/methylation domain-containing protein [Oligoflexia bacterium]|nr:prepilin-type N-terminal cleavage/methylation domain-containing protein [Oligoflexia bacterium]HMP48359.1 prepilin-type N-terminal cleavage/methylation domain-containing protein [Oligoflexia bacterium]